MVTSIRAVYENGKFIPLEPLDLRDGQEVSLTISADDPLLAALGDLVLPVEAVADPLVDEAALLSELDAAYRGIKPVSETIIEERQTGP